MPTIHADHILIPPARQRREFDPVAILELAQSIKTHGLLHAIVLRPDGKTLIAGERRLRAIREHLIPFGHSVLYNEAALPPGQIPCVIASSTDSLVIKEIELDENLKRRDLTWQEHAAAVAELHALRQAQAKSASIPLPGGVAIETISPHTITDTVNELGSTFQTVRAEILIAKHLDRPEISAAPDLKTAFKTLKRIEEADRNRAIAEAVGLTYSAGVHQAFNANCIEWMAQPEWAGKFDVILTDPPYGMGAHDFGDGAGRMSGIEHHYDDSYEGWLKLMQAWCSLAWAVTKPQAHAYIFCDIDRFHELRGLMQAAGWYVFRTPLTNYKQNSGRVPLPDRGPRRQSEWCLYAIKGDKAVTKIASDVIVTASDEQMSHGAQKPVALYEDLLSRSVRPGNWVLDTFSGTGTIFPAAHTFKCIAVGVEQSPEYFGMGLKRLEGLQAQGELNV